MHVHEEACVRYRGATPAFPPLLVSQLHGRAVLFGPSEIILRHITAEEAFRRVVIFLEGRSIKAQKSRVGAAPPGKLAGLGGVRLVSNHDDIFRVRQGSLALTS